MPTFSWPIYCELSEVSCERALKIMNLYGDDKLQNSKLRELANQGIEKLKVISGE